MKKNNLTTGAFAVLLLASTVAGADQKYPAADFQPEVLYHDPNYKPDASVKKNVVKEEIGTESVQSQNVTTAASKEESSLSSYLIGLVVLAFAGFYLFKKSSAAPVQKKTTTVAPVRNTYALNTGVAKYLNKVSGTGVSRYLEKHVKSATAATGVAKYMAKQAASTKTTAAKAATGVEKYMRDRG